MVSNNNKDYRGKNQGVGMGYYVGKKVRFTYGQGGLNDVKK